MPGDSFKEFILDQLTALGPINCRAMFGGHGLYHNNIFFGIIFKGRLYFKTDSETRAEYSRHGMKAFRYSSKQTLKNYYEVPADVTEDGEELALWARTATRI